MPCSEDCLFRTACFRICLYVLANFSGFFFFFLKVTLGLGKFKELQQLNRYKNFKQILKVVGLWNSFQLFSLNFLKFAKLLNCLIYICILRLSCVCCLQLP